MVLAVIAGVAVTTAATAAYVFSHLGNQPPPPGPLTVKVYTVDEPISRVVSAADRPGVISRFIGWCDADTYYVKVDGTEQCVVLQGPFGAAQATVTPDGVELSPDQAADALAIVQRTDPGSPEPPTRVMLAYDGGWAALVRIADLDSGTSVHSSAIS
jgi:hypothetical protein